MNLYNILNVHKETVLFSGGGFNVKCKLKPSAKHEGFPLFGFSTFTGCTFSKDGEAFFGDTFEITIDLKQLEKLTDLRPVRGWFVTVEFPQLNDKEVEFQVENAPFDRTMGTYLLRCATATQNKNENRINRNGGI